MNIIVQSSIKTLSKSVLLLNSLTDETLGNNSVPPYYSCIGSHIRHILDFYNCILDGISEGKVDLTDRKRDLEIHKNCRYAIENVNHVISKLQKLEPISLSTKIQVIDDLGLGKTNIDYTLGALFAQANSHAIHHYAIINYVLDRLGIEINDDTFGYNPTTPKQEINLN